MIFVDHQNFCRSLQEIDSYRQEKTSGLSDFIMDYLSKELKWYKHTPRLIRTYVYTGEYTDSLINKIDGHLKDEISRGMEIETAEKIQAELDKASRGRVAQKMALDAIRNNSSFLEIRTKPLQYSFSKVDVFQKGVDVQLAVDLVSHAYINSYDVAVVCSGDVDLIESIRLVKNLGKKVIILSHPQSIAKEIRKEADHFIDMSLLRADQLDRISHIGTPHTP